MNEEVERQLKLELDKFKVSTMPNPQPPKKYFTKFTFSMNELRRIFLESIELVFTLHNIKRMNFGVCKLLDMMDQIIPTGCTVGTAFWVLYTNNEESVCSCYDYKRHCRHKVDENLHAWLTDYEYVERINFVPKFSGVVYPKNVEFLAKNAGAYVDVMQEFCVGSNTLDSSTNYCIVSIVSRYLRNTRHRLQQENTILIFDPNPVVHPYYGWLFSDILLNMYPYYYKQTVVCLAEAANYTIHRIHSYVNLQPSINYKVEAPPIFSPDSDALTDIDYELINDICSNLIEWNDPYNKNQLIECFRNKCLSQRKAEGSSSAMFN